MTREKAIKIIKEFINGTCLHLVDQEALETLIPELAESEDERIRKEIVGVIQKHYPNTPESYRWISWLEKQKERGPLTKEEEYILHRIIEYLEDETCPSEWISLLHDIYCLPYEKQEDQKPVESISQLTVQDKGVYKICPRCKSRMIRDDSKVYTSMPPQYGYECPTCGEMVFDTTMYDNPKMDEQKPAECTSDSALQKIKRAITDYKKLSEHYKDTEENFYQYYGGKADGLQLALIYFGYEKEPHYTKRNVLFDKCVKNCDPDVMKSVSDEVDEMLEKEQKPWKVGENAYFTPEQKPTDLPAGFYVTLPDGEKYYAKEMRCNGMNVKVVEPKPVEWDEYTKTNLDRALQIIKKAKGTLQGYQSDDGIYECDKAIECLEHFLYRGLEIEKLAEWSKDYREEDIQTRFAFYTYKDELGTLYLSNVFVEESSRNHGFGTKILAAAEKVAETIGATTICLKVKQDSPANAWYRKNGYGYVAFEDGYDWLEKNLEYMKPNRQEWDEFDKDCLKRAVWYIENPAPSVVKDANLVLWLKSLPGRFTLQPKQEWSEGEKKMLAVISYKISQHQGNDERSLFTPDEAEFIGGMEEKLKSLRPSWKASKDQIDGLFHACNRMCGDRYHKDLVELYEQLKQL